jgi:hypothetical protein
MALIINFLFLNPYSMAYQPSEGNIHYLIGSTFYKSLYNPTSQDPDVPLRNDFGFVVQGDVNATSSLEISMLHQNRDFYRNENDQFAAELLEVMKMGLGYRRWFSETWNFGFLISNTYAMAEPKPISRRPLNNSVVTSGTDVSEFGLVISIQKIIWEKDQNSIVFDLAYERNQTAKVGESMDYLQTFLAFRRFVQGKNRQQR